MKYPKSLIIALYTFIKNLPKKCKAFWDKMTNWFQNFWGNSSVSNPPSKDNSTGSKKSQPLTSFFSYCLSKLLWLIFLSKLTLFPLFRSIWTKITNKIGETRWYPDREGVNACSFVLFVSLVDGIYTGEDLLCEPIEWGLAQVWLVFTVAFACIIEHFISRRFYNCDRTDKRIWEAWHRAYWPITVWYAFSFGVTVWFFITPWPCATHYTVPLMLWWWDWYTRAFLFKFITILSIALYVAEYFKATIRVSSVWEVSFTVLIVTLLLLHLLVADFAMLCSIQLLEPCWYCRPYTPELNYFDLVMDRWFCGNSTWYDVERYKFAINFWYQTESPFRIVFVFAHLLSLAILLPLSVYWIRLLLEVFSGAVAFTYAMYCVSILRQALWSFLLLHFLVVFILIFLYVEINVQHTDANFMDVFVGYLEILILLLLG